MNCLFEWVFDDCMRLALKRLKGETHQPEQDEFSLQRAKAGL